MDPRNRADEALARARARGAFVVTPDNATSPMDSSSTVRIPREAVRDADRDDLDPDATMIIPNGSGPGTGVEWPQPTDQEADPRSRPRPSETSAREAVPPNPYRNQRGPGEFGPLGSRAAQQYPQQ